MLPSTSASLSLRAVGLVLALAAANGCAGSPQSVLVAPSSVASAPSPRVIVSSASRPSTDENGRATTFTVRLAEAPDADVRIALASSLPSEGRLGARASSSRRARGPWRRR